MTEDELLGEVIALCDEYGVLWFHDYDSRRDVPGFPDLVLAGMSQLLFAELKSAYGQLRPGQTTWRYRLMAAGQQYELWRPADLASGHIESVIKHL